VITDVACHLKAKVDGSEVDDACLLRSATTAPGHRAGGRVAGTRVRVRIGARRGRRIDVEELGVRPRATARVSTVASTAHRWPSTVILFAIAPIQRLGIPFEAIS
jgi:hypothetical protein